MNKTTRSFAMILATVAAGLTLQAEPRPRPERDAQNQFRFSTTVERERPKLNAETKALIAAYHRDPSEANKAALRKQIEVNYDKVVARKKAKLAELKRTARHQEKIDEMQEIVDQMARERGKRVEQSLKRFTDPRLRPGSRTAKDGFHPVMGAGAAVSIAHTPVTNAEYAEFVKATGHAAPKYWASGNVPDGKADHPVLRVSYEDAVAYCAYLTKRDGRATYRLPTEEEWELAAGHMPKDAAFNWKGTHEEIADRRLHDNPLPKGTSYTTPVTTYTNTLAACGAVDMWGNCWEWTSTDITATNGAEKGLKVKAVKGGSWYANKNSCRTEFRGEGRNPNLGYNTVGFRVVRVAASSGEAPRRRPPRRRPQK
ncbi:MAG: formylglycine-generating enzyme family protein [Kiritimatiellia bacterium]